MRVRCATLGIAALALALANAPRLQAARDEAAPFLGEWDVQLHNTGTTFEAAWLKFFREGGKLDARMQWRWGGVTGVKSIKITDGELQWVRPEWWEEKQKNVDTTYHARVENGKLVGWVKMPDGTMIRFTGVPSVDKIDVSGKWVGIADEDPDSIERILVLKQKDGKITGTYDDGEVKAQVKNAKLKGNKLSFEISGQDFHVVCDAVVEGDRMRGEYDLDGEIGTFHAKLQLKEGKKIVLLDGTSLKGWRSRDPKRKKPKWGVKDGYIYPLPGATDIVSTEKFQDFLLHVEYRFPPDEPAGNSGIYVRGRYEVQLLDDHGKGVSPHGAGAIYGRVAPIKNVTKPRGTWQTMDIRLVGKWITVIHNGVVVVDHAYLEGITGGALDAHENEPGPIMLQAHGQKINFRRVEVRPLLR